MMGPIVTYKQGRVFVGGEMHTQEECDLMIALIEALKPFLKQAPNDPS